MQESNFSRTMYNIQKAGAYYTDLLHCSRLAQMFDWPEEEVSILEPSAGNGAAVIEVTKKCTNRKIFTVELMRDAVKELKNNANIYEALCCDFMSTKISHKAFSFCFSNPPYLDNEGRMEISFLKRIEKYLTVDAVLVYVIPMHVATSLDFLEIYLSCFEPLYEFRFSEEEYSKFKQVVFIGRKKEINVDVQRDILQSYAERKKEEFEELPSVWTNEKIKVFPSLEKKITFFTAIKFDEEVAFEDLKKTNPHVRNLKKLSIEPYKEDQIGRPPTMPNKNVLYLLSTLGCGSGRTGSAENMDEHLQRGHARVEERKFEELDDKGQIVEVTQKSTKITVTILEQSGKFSILE